MCAYVSEVYRAEAPAGGAGGAGVPPAAGQQQQPEPAGSLSFTRVPVRVESTEAERLTAEHTSSPSDAHAAVAAAAADGAAGTARSTADSGGAAQGLALDDTEALCA